MRLALVLVLAAASASLPSPAHAGEPAKTAAPGCPAVGVPAPPFSFPIPLSQSGERATLASLKAKGKPAVLAFWAWNCAPCILEMPALQKLAADWGETVTVLLVHVGEDEQRMRGALDKWDIRLTSALDDSGLLSKAKYCVTELPRLFVLDQKGTVGATLGSLGEKFEATVRAEVSKVSTGTRAVKVTK